MGQIMFTFCISRELRVFKIIIIYIFFIEFIDNEKIEEVVGGDDDVYPLYI
jgi:hypothetical protein